MKTFLIFLALTLCLFLESTFITLPFVLLGIFLFAIFFKEAWIFWTAFLMGIFLDVLSFRPIGESSLFFIIMLGIVFIYQRKFEIQSLQFVTIFSFIVSLIYGVIFREINIFGESILVALISGVIFLYLSSSSAINKTSKVILP